MNRAVVLAVIVAACVGWAQQFSHRDPPPPESRPILRVDTNLVLVPVTVTDSRGAVVPNLDRTKFVLTEERQHQEIISFSHETAPVSLALVVDLSGSMANKIATARVAVEAILDNLEDEDEELLVTFADTAELRLPFTDDTSAIRGALTSAEPRGSTALFDAVALAVHEMHRAQNRRRVLFLISDGGDNHSRLTKRELRGLLDEEDVQIHAIGIHDRMASREESRGPWILEDLAKMTGGRHQMVDDIGQLPTLAGEMSRALHDRYLLGYKPTPLGLSGSFRRIDVKLVQAKGAPKLYVYARRGYHMP